MIELFWKELTTLRGQLFLQKKLHHRCSSEFLICLSPGQWPYFQKKTLTDCLYGIKNSQQVVNKYLNKSIGIEINKLTLSIYA